MISNKELSSFTAICRPAVIISLFLSVFYTTDAQYSSNSIYSLYNLGDLNSSGPVKTSAMGGAAFALKSEDFLNNLNPASFTEFDSTTFMFSMGLNGYVSSFESMNESKSAADFNFNHIALGFPVTKWWGSCAGVIPFSSVGYDILTTVPVEGTNTSIETKFTGTGGVNQFYLIHSFRLTRQLSLGINVSYLMGTITQTELNNMATFNQSDISTVQTRYFRNFYYALGLQYNQQFYDNKLSIGITCSPGQKLNTRYSMEIIIPEADTLHSKPVNKDDYMIPLSLGAGLACNIHSNLEFVFDYGIQKWSDAELSFNKARLTDSYHYNFGIQYRPAQKLIRSYLRSIRYRLGAYYENTYLEMRGNPIREIGITFGAGIPVSWQKSTINIAIGIGKLGTLNNGLVQETYCSFNLGFDFHDYWFIKRRYD